MNPNWKTEGHKHNSRYIPMLFVSTIEQLQRIQIQTFIKLFVNIHILLFVYILLKFLQRCFIVAVFYNTDYII